MDLNTMKGDPLADSYPTVTEKDVGRTEVIDYKASDGLALQGVLTLPPGKPAKGVPLIVLPHGGPESHDTVHFNWWAQAFASRGYAVWQPNFRGSSGYGRAFRDAGFGQWGRKMQTDISDAFPALAERGVDTKRACIVGGSYGGYAALAGVTLQHGLYKCAVSYGGVADPGVMLENERRSSGYESTAATRYWRKFMGEGDLAAISPARLADKADAPVLLIHGLDDSVVAFDQSRRMRDALERAGKPVELITLPGEDHWLSREVTRVQMLKNAVAFVEKHNPPT